MSEKVNYRWLNGRVQIGGKHYVYRRLMERPLEPRYRRGDWKQSFTKEKRSIPVAVIEYGGELITGDKLVKVLRTLETQRIRKTLAKGRRP